MLLSNWYRTANEPVSPEGLAKSDVCLGIVQGHHMPCAEAGPPGSAQPLDHWQYASRFVSAEIVAIGKTCGHLHQCKADVAHPVTHTSKTASRCCTISPTQRHTCMLLGNTVHMTESSWYSCHLELDYHSTIMMRFHRFDMTRKS